MLLLQGLFLCSFADEHSPPLIKGTFTRSLLLWETETSQDLETPPQLLLHRLSR